MNGRNLGQNQGAGGSNFGPALGAIFGSMGGNPGKPYQRESETLQNYLNSGQTLQNPFYNAGTFGLDKFANWLTQMRDPSQFINNLMNQYQESPWARNQKQNAIREATNLGSATGLIGSTPLTEHIQQNAANISSEDMGKWLSHVLGINSQYGQGWENLAHIGQGSANALTGMLQDYGKDIARNEYNQEAAKENQHNNFWGGVGSIASMFLPKGLGG